MAKKKIKKEQEDRKVQVPIKWNIPGTLNSIYANNMLVQILEHEFKILFFETKPTTRINADDPKEKEVRADCVASIIISPLKLPAFIEVLQRQFASYMKRGELELERIKKAIPNEPGQPS